MAQWARDAGSTRLGARSSNGPGLPDEVIAWDARLDVTGDGKGLVKNAGVVLPVKVAGSVGVVSRIAAVFGHGRADRLCRGMVLVTAAAAVAAGARSLSEVERLLAHRRGTLGWCGSDSTLWRVLDSIDEKVLVWLRRAVA